MEILVRHFNKVEGKFMTLEDFTHEDNDHILKELKGSQPAEFKMKEATSSLECRLVETLSMTQTMKDKTKHPRKV